MFVAFTPNDCKILSITEVSSISGMLCNVTLSAVSKVAAIHGNAAFLFPLAVIVPLIGNPPSIKYSYISKNPFMIYLLN